MRRVGGDHPPGCINHLEIHKAVAQQAVLASSNAKAATCKVERLAGWERRQWGHWARIQRGHWRGRHTVCMRSGSPLGAPRLVSLAGAPPRTEHEAAEPDTDVGAARDHALLLQHLVVQRAQQYPHLCSDDTAVGAELGGVHVPGQVKSEGTLLAAVPCMARPHGSDRVRACRCAASQRRRCIGPLGAAHVRTFCRVPAALGHGTEAKPARALDGGLHLASAVWVDYCRREGLDALVVDAPAGPAPELPMGGGFWNAGRLCELQPGATGAAQQAVQPCWPSLPTTI